MRALRFAAVMAAALLIAGCYWDIVLETRMFEDGVIERRVVLTAQNVRGISDQFDTPSRAGWQVYELGQDTYALRGVFASPTTMPAGYVRLVKTTGETAPTQVAWAVRDRVLYTLYEYRETVTNIVSADRFDSTASTLIELGADLASRIVDHRLRDTYDVTRLQAFLAGDGRRMAKSLAWSIFEARNADWLDTPVLLEKVNRVVGRYGIRLAPADLSDDDTAPLRILAAAFGDRVRLKAEPTRPLTGEERLRAASVLTDTAAVQRVTDKWLVERFGSQDAGDTFIGRALSGIFGAYSIPLSNDCRFTAGVRMAGRMLRANGYLVGPAEVRWAFSGAETYPTGYSMEADSFILKFQAQRSLAPKEFLRESSEVMEFEVLLMRLRPAAQARFLAVLRDAVNAGSMAPLDALVGDADFRPLVEKIKGWAAKSDGRGTATREP